MEATASLEAMLNIGAVGLLKVTTVQGYKDDVEVNRCNEADCEGCDKGHKKNAGSNAQETAELS